VCVHGRRSDGKRQTACVTRVAIIRNVVISNVAIGQFAAIRAVAPSFVHLYYRRGPATSVNAFPFLIPNIAVSGAQRPFAAQRLGVLASTFRVIATPGVFVFPAQSGSPASWTTSGIDIGLFLVPFFRPPVFGVSLGRPTPRTVIFCLITTQPSRFLNSLHFVALLGNFYFVSIFELRQRGAGGGLHSS
jgi:hypothetical protein